MNNLQLIYKRFQPHQKCSSYIDYIWMIQAPGSKDVKREILIPNGRPSLVFCLATPGICIDPLTKKHIKNNNIVFGITTRPFILEQQGQSFYIGVQLKPYGLAFQRDRLVDQFIPLKNWFDVNEINELIKSLLMHDFEKEGREILQKFLQKKFEPISNDKVQILQSILDRVENQRGIINVDELLENFHRSYTSLYRLFRTYLGISPKKFIEITRYYNFVGELLGNHQANSKTILTLLEGYYDQSHADKDFKRFTGVNQKTFKKIYNGIAFLMHQK